MPVLIAFFIEFIIFLALWLWDDYVGFMLSVTFALISLFIFLIALIAEWLDRSKVPRLYFYIMAISVITPLIASGVYILLMGTDFDWLKG
ncbi:MAG: hypothetical protein AB8G22_27570 [Saprospiraceae bacterium]